MTTPIKFNRKIKLITKEIKNIPSQRVLAAKFESTEIPVP